MFLRHLMSILMMSAIAIPTLADNRLFPPAKARYLVLDGENAAPLDIDSKAGVVLKNGPHQLVFQLRSLIRESGDTNMYTSKPYIMTFDLQGDTTYTIKAPDLMKPSDTDRLEKTPAEQFSVISQDGVSIAFELASLNNTGLLSGDLIIAVQKFNLSDNPAAVREFSGLVAPAITQTSVALMPAPETAVPASESMLKYWYNQADKETRKRFLQWVAEENK